jgi:hypothetical protein
MKLTTLFVATMATLTIASPNAMVSTPKDTSATSANELFKRHPCDPCVDYSTSASR